VASVAQEIVAPGAVLAIASLKSELVNHAALPRSARMDWGAATIARSTQSWG
jgi:hypothetical protein